LLENGASIMNITLKSSAIRCGGCANNVRAALSKSPGVQAVRVEPGMKLVNVDFDEQSTSAQSIADQLAQAGFPADEPPTTRARRLCR
jgi:copper chaperone CopZ